MEETKVNDFRLVVVVINYKTPQLVCDALNSLKGQLDLEMDHVVIVDNFSQDESVESISSFIQSKNWSGWVSVVQSAVNGGFSAGNNIGIQSANAKYYLLLNSDAYVRNNALQSLLAVAEANPSIGIVGPKLEWPDEKQQVSCFYNLSPANSFLQSAKTGIFTKLFGFFGVKEVAMPLELHNIEQPEWLSFACVLLRGEMVNDIGLMDEGYFMYSEDNDYCRRAIEAGWELKFDPAASVVHLNKGDSNQSFVKRLPRYYFRSRSRYFIKYYGRFGLFIANVLWSMGRSVSLLRELVQRKPRVFHSSMLLDIWTGFLMPAGNK